MITSIIGWTTWTDISRIWYDDIGTKQDTLIARHIVARELRQKGYRINGYIIQRLKDDLYGVGLVPVFNNNTKFRCTLKEWGEIMIDAYPEDVGNDPFAYAMWAYGPPADYDIVYPKILLHHHEITF